MKIAVLTDQTSIDADLRLIGSAISQHLGGKKIPISVLMWNKTADKIAKIISTISTKPACHIPYSEKDRIFPHCSVRIDYPKTDNNFQIARLLLDQNDGILAFWNCREAMNPIFSVLSTAPKSKQIIVQKIRGDK